MGNSVKIRQARLEDVEGIQEVWHSKAVVDGLGGPSFRQEIGERIRKGRHAVAESNGEIVGFLGVGNFIPHRLTLDQLGVREDFMNQGVAEKLYFYWLVKASYRRVLSIDDRVIVSDNPAMVLWMPKMGFIRSILMRKKTRSCKDYALYTFYLNKEGVWETWWVRKGLEEPEVFEFELTDDDETSKKKNSEGEALKNLDLDSLKQLEQNSKMAGLVLREES